jgi:uncharacterized membrane protein YfcA
MAWISLLLLTCLASVAFCYAAVGHGGASGYIAVFALFGMISPSMKSFVLLMNLAVASVSFIQYYKNGYFKVKYFLPFGIGAAPMAYLGASLKIDAVLYHYILAAFLFFSVIYLLDLFKTNQDQFKTAYSVWKAFAVALILGFLSGVTGVGGGIFLSPVLLIFGWLNLKQTAAISALFIVVNSLAGLLALNNVEVLLNVDTIYKLLLVSSFGYLGSRWGVKNQKLKVLRLMLSFVLLIAALKLCLI